jgi:hypothetical protein
MPDLTLHQVIRRTTYPHQTDASVAECVQTASLDSKFITQRVQHSEANVSVGQGRSVPCTEYESSCAPVQKLGKHFDCTLINEHLAVSLAGFRWDFPAIPD